MPLYDVDNFHNGLIPDAFKKETKEVISIAVILGWKMHKTSAQGITLIAPGDPSPKKYHFGMAGRSTNSISRIRRDIIKYADPEKLLAADLVREGPREIAELASIFLGRFDDPGTVVDDTNEAIEEREPAPKPAPKPKRKREPLPEVPERAADAVVVSEKPMIAKASEGKAYESQVAVERKWSDGSTDYRCADCDYSSPHRLSIRGHCASHKKGRTVIPPRFEADVPDAVSYAPRQSRIDALAQHIADAMAAGAVDPQSIAREALTWVHAQSRKGTQFAEEREPMSAEEALDRIRALVDTPGERLQTRQQIDSLMARASELEERAAVLDEKATALQARVTDSEEYALSMEERAEKAESTLQAFRELVADLGTEAKAG